MTTRACIALVLGLILSGPVQAQVLINELVASNANGATDEWGDADDWLELYNAGDEPVDVGGMFLSDDVQQPARWMFPIGSEQTMIAPRGFLVVWADGEDHEGVLHTNFALQKNGEEVVLTDSVANGQLLLDHIIYGPQNTDDSLGRFPDGGVQLRIYDIPSPGESNLTYLPTDTPTPTVTPSPTVDPDAVDADLDNDGDVDQADLLLFHRRWHQPAATPAP